MLSRTGSSESGCRRSVLPSLPSWFGLPEWNRELVYNLIPRLLLDRGRVCNVEHLLAHYHAGNGTPPLVTMKSVRHGLAVGWQLDFRVVAAQLSCEVVHVTSCWSPLILHSTVRLVVFELVMGNLDILALTGTSAGSQNVFGCPFVYK